jgi:methyl-accepting chemotaxis protein
MSLHLPIAILAALSLPSGDCVVSPYDGPLMGINHGRSAHSSLNEARSFIQLDLSEVIATETVTKFENLNASIAHDLRVGWERVENKDVTVALEYAENCVRDWSEIVVLTLNPPDHGPMMLPMSFSARAKLFGLAICTALVALILAIFLDIL